MLVLQFVLTRRRIRASQTTIQPGFRNITSLSQTSYDVKLENTHTQQMGGKKKGRDQDLPTSFENL